MLHFFEVSLADSIQTVKSTLNASPTRRQLLTNAARQCGGVALAGGLMGFPALNLRAQTGFNAADASQSPNGFWERPRWLWLKRPATGEQLRLVYWKDGNLIPEAHQQASWFLRDVRFQGMLASKDSRIRNALNSGLIREEHLSPWVLMDPILLDIQYAFCAWLSFHGISSPLLVTSGFRHVVTNSLTEGAARDSWHIRGGASDLVVPGIMPEALAKFGQWLSGGGVGLYANRNFIHIDRGRVRSWRG